MILTSVGNKTQLVYVQNMAGTKKFYNEKTIVYVSIKTSPQKVKVH